MKITVLIENTTADPDLQCEHGLSLYIETGDHRILFDMGQSAAFADNAEKMGVDLCAVDLAVLSHGHYDHGGGIFRFLEINKKAPLYLSAYALEPHYNGSHKDIGLDRPLLEQEKVRCRLHFTEERRAMAGVETMSMDQPVILGTGLELYSCGQLPMKYPLDPAGLKMWEKGRLILEDFRHEQYLLVHEGGKRILFSGCSHRGVLNIVERFHPDILIGGFHFSKWEPDGPGRERLDHAAQILCQNPCTYYTCHCTGTRQYDYLKRQMGDCLQYLSTGQTLEIL